jgi:DNA-binding CsgD family transcriptional regulator
MEKYAVLTGDIVNFTQLPDKERLKLISETESLLKSWVNQPNEAEVFRGDSFQLIIGDITTAIKKGIQLICWFKKHSDEKNKIYLSSRISVGIGAIAYKGKSVLDSDGEAFHLSGRNFDKMTDNEVLSIKTANDSINEQIAIILTFANIVIDQLTAAQAEVIYMAIDNYTQTRMAEELGIKQGAVNSRLKLANWKTIHDGINYITELIK